MNMIGRTVMIAPACPVSSKPGTYQMQEKGTYIEPSSQHPGTMLVDSQPLYVDVCHKQRGQEHEGYHPKRRLRIQATTKSPSRHDQRPGRPRNTQQQDDVSVDSVPQDALVSNSRHELKNDEKGRREDTGEMQKHPSAVQTGSVIVAFAGAGSVCWTEASAAENIIDIDVHEASERESHQGAAEDEE
jgi:hypothetical protein